MHGGFPGGSVVKNLPAMNEAQVRFLDWEDPLKEDMATHSSILTWRIPWTEEPGGLHSIGLNTIEHSSGGSMYPCMTYTLKI